MTIRVLARAVARPETRQSLQQALVQNRDASRREAGCLRYDVAQGAADPNEFTTIEEWRSEADAAAHLKTPHVAALLAAVPALVAAPPDIRTYRTIA